jgi:uncharacterized protein
VIVISDTSPIANLHQIGRLDLLRQMFGKVIIPPAVDVEIRKLEDFSVDITEYKEADWIEIIAPKNNKRVRHFLATLDAGESEAIVVAQENGAEYLLIDERLGTKAALENGIQTIGLIGILLKAKKIGLIKMLTPTLEELEHEAGFWIGSKLKNTVLKDAGE